MSTETLPWEEKMKFGYFAIVIFLIFSYQHFSVKADSSPPIKGNVESVSYPQGNQIMFVDEGVVANQLGFIHVKTEIDIQNVVNSFAYINNTLTDLIAGETQRKKDLEMRQHAKNFWKTDVNKKYDENEGTGRSTKRLEEFYRNDVFDSLVVLENIQDKLNFLWSEFEDMITPLPHAEGVGIVSKNLFHNRFKKDVNRPERSLALGAALLFGLPGTIMGFMNNNQIMELNKRVDSLDGSFNNLIDITEAQGKALEGLSYQQKDLQAMMERFAFSNRIKLLSYCETFFIRMQSIVNKISSAVDSAQNHRLSSRAINGETLTNLFKYLQNEALKDGSDLFLSHPSDLYQVDTSYLFDSVRKAFTLVIHVPMVPKDQQLTLQRYLPFPMVDSFNHNASILPDLGERVYLASNPKHEYRIMSQADLLSCTKRGTLHLCLGRNSLRTDLRKTCLGGLFLKDMQGVKDYCRFVLHKPAEYVIGVTHAKWLVSTHEDFSAEVVCDSRSLSIPFQKQTLIKISPGCKVKLRDNILTTDKSRDITAGVHVIDWEIDVDLFASQSNAFIEKRLAEFEKLGPKVFQAKDLSHLKIVPYDYSHNYITYALIGCALLLITIMTSCCYYQRRKVNRLIGVLNEGGDGRPTRLTKMKKWKVLHRRMKPLPRSKAVKALKRIYSRPEPVKTVMTDRAFPTPLMERKALPDFNIIREVAKVEAPPPVYSVGYSFEDETNHHQNPFNSASSTRSSLYPQLAAEVHLKPAGNPPPLASHNQVLGRGCNVTIGSCEDISRFVCTSHDPDQGCSGAMK